jgi:hypothetical protein
MMTRGMKIEREHERPVNFVFLGQNAMVPATELQTGSIKAAVLSRPILVIKFSC